MGELDLAWLGAAGAVRARGEEARDAVRALSAVQVLLSQALPHLTGVLALMAAGAAEEEVEAARLAAAPVLWELQEVLGGDVATSVAAIGQQLVPSLALVGVLLDGWEPPAVGEGE